ncbi:hypothetical protein [Rhodococcus daqingensis]|uniref:Uncharacterized protein n=1 Tax=Rhodococcus daqingensis TaxID=2479363 RepID=A0ABW2S013_9NOCA
MSEGSEDTGQISVAELLARNGQQVESRGGRRRRGVAGGGISVAELTGEIPVIRPPEDSRHTIPEVPDLSVAPPAPVSPPEPVSPPVSLSPPEPVSPPAPAAVTPPQPAAPPEPAAPPQPAPQPRSRRADRSPVSPVVARYTVPERERPTIPPVPEVPRGETPKFEAPKFEVPEFEVPKVEPVAPVSAPVAPAPAPAPVAPVAATPTQYRAAATPDATSATTVAALPPQYGSQSGSFGRVSVPPAPAEAPKVRPETSMRAPIADQPKTSAMPAAEIPPAPRPGFVPYTPVREPALLSGSSVEGDLMRQARAAGTSRRETLEEARALVHVTGEIPRVVVPKTSAPTASALKERALKESVAEDSAREGAVLGSAEPADSADRAADEVVDDAPSDRNDKQAAREWAVLIGQGIVALLVGGLLFKGFEKLWDVLPWVALVLAVLVIAGLVAVVRILRQTDDLVSLLIAIIVGVFVTIGPLAFLLTT